MQLTRIEKENMEYFSHLCPEGIETGFSSSCPEYEKRLMNRVPGSSLSDLERVNRRINVMLASYNIAA